MNAPQSMDPFQVKPQLSLKAVEQAANWHVRLHASHTHQTDEAEFTAWCSQHPDNAEAYKRLEALWGQFNEVEAAPAMAALESVLQTKSQPRRGKLPAKSVMLGLALIMASWLGLKTETATYFLSDYSTAVGEQRVVELADHSRIMLNTYSAIDVDFSGSQRHITLRKGEILVEVAKDASRPFIVETGQGTARALGTRFVVRRDDNRTTVSVVESVVEACAARSLFSNDDKKCVRLHAGQGTSMATDTIAQPASINTDAAAGWASGMLAVDNRPLAEVLQELERYRSGRIYVDPEIRSLRVSGVFPLNDTDRALQVLAGILPIHTQQYTPLLTVVRAQ